MIKMWGGQCSGTSRWKWIGPGSSAAFRPPSPEYQERKLAASGRTAGGRAAYKVNTRKTKRRCHAG